MCAILAFAASIIALSICPVWTAFCTAKIASTWRSCKCEINTISAPACSVANVPCVTPMVEAIAAISMQSVMIKPVKPSAFRNSPVSTFLDSVAGKLGSDSIAGKITCAVIIASTCASIAALKGANSIASKRSRTCGTNAEPICESVDVSPCPGKCLAQRNMPPAFKPRNAAPPKRLTVATSSPNERTPITGLSGLLLTSKTGAKLKLIPI